MASGLFPHPPLAQRRILLVAVFGPLLIALSIAFATAQLAYHELREQGGDALAELAFHMSETLNSGVYERFGDLMQLVQRHDFPELVDKPEQLRSYFEQQQRLFPEYAWLGFVQPDGTVRAGSGGLLEGKNILAREWVRGGMQGPFAGDVHEALLLASLLPRPQDGEPLRLVDLALPVHDRRGKLLGVMGAHLSWQWAKELRAKLLSHDLQRRKIEILVLSAKGTVLLGSSGNAANGHDLSRLESVRHAFEHKIGAVFEQWNDGKRYAVGYARGQGHRDFSGLSWIVLARQPEETAAADASRVRLVILLVGLVVGLLAGLFVGAAALRVAQPLRDLCVENCPPSGTGSVAAAHEVAWYAAVLRQCLQERVQEQERLVRDNRSLREEADQAGELRRRSDDLRRTMELRVLERTADLQETVVALEQRLAFAEQQHRDEKRGSL